MLTLFHEECTFILAIGTFASAFYMTFTITLYILGEDYEVLGKDAREASLAVTS